MVMGIVGEVLMPVALLTRSEFRGSRLTEYYSTYVSNQSVRITSC